MSLGAIFVACLDSGAQLLDYCQLLMSPGAQEGEVLQPAQQVRPHEQGQHMHLLRGRVVQATTLIIMAE